MALVVVVGLCILNNKERALCQCRHTVLVCVFNRSDTLSGVLFWCLNSHIFVFRGTVNSIYFKLCPFGVFAIRSTVQLIKGSLITCYCVTFFPLYSI